MAVMACFYNHWIGQVGPVSPNLVLSAYDTCMNEQFVYLLCSWPLAIVGKLIPVPKTPMSVYFKKPFRKYKASRNA